MRIIRILFWIGLLCSITGCLNQQILDDVQLATAAGYELGEDNETLVATAVFPVYKPDLSVENKTYTSSSELSKVIRDKLNRQSPKPFVSGKIEVSLYSKELAEKGIFEIIDTFRRDPQTGAKMFLAIVEGNLKEQLKIQYGDTDNGMFFSDLIEHNIESGILPKTNLHLFAKAYHSEGKDPFLPYLKLEAEKAEIKGIALFKGDKYIDYIKEENNYIFMFLNEKFSSDATFTVQLGEDGVFASVFHVKANRNYKIENKEAEPKITINIKTEAVIQEFSGKSLNNKLKKQIEKKMEEDIKKKADEMIAKFQELNIDPLGIGYQVKHRSRNWEKKSGRHNTLTYLKVKVKVDISEAGVIS